MVDSYIPESSGDELALSYRAALKARGFESGALNDYIKTEFVSRRKPFVVIDGRFYFKSGIHIFYQANGVDLAAPLEGIRLYAVDARFGGIWTEAIKEAFKIPEAGMLSNYTGEFEPRAVFVSVYDGVKYAHACLPGSGAAKLIEGRPEESQAEVITAVRLGALLKLLMSVTGFDERAFRIRSCYPLPDEINDPESKELDRSSSVRPSSQDPQ